MAKPVILVPLVAVIASVSGGSVALAQDRVTHKVGCETLKEMTIPAAAVGLPTSGATIGSADLVPDSPLTMAGERAVLAIPEYCKVVGSIAPVDRTAPPINFQVNLPLSWNTQVLSDMDLAPPFAVHATFPMCRYPMYPRYKGSGDPKVAGSYTCTRP